MPPTTTPRATTTPATAGRSTAGISKGIEQKLDYIKALGATAIWISPVVLNGHGQFHGYAGRDFYQVAPHWGSLADLQHMIQAAHARGMLVIDDIIVNHGDDLIYSTDSGYDGFQAPPAGYTLKYRSSSLTYAPPFDIYNSTYNSANNALTNLFHNNGGIPDYNTAQHVELGELSGLDDFRTESAYVRSNMVEIYKYWIGQAGFDGFRIDTVKHVEMGFWQNWCPLVHAYAASIGKPNFFMFGEVYDGSDAKCGSYTGTQSGGAFALDSVVDYPLYFKVDSVFASASGNTKQIEDRYGAIAANYDPAAQMRLVTFLDNHDQAALPEHRRRYHRPAQRGAGLPLHRPRRALPLLRHRAGLQRRHRPQRPRRHVRRPIRARALAGRQLQHDASAVPDGGQAQQFPPPLSGAAHRLPRQPVE